MNNTNSPTEQTPEEKEKLKNIYTAYNLAGWSMQMFWLFGLLVVVVDIMLRKGHPFKIAMFLLGLCICIPASLLQNRKRKAWLKNLTEEDKALLQRAAQEPVNRLLDPSQLARQILEECKQVEVNAEKELLRASTSARADELLRPNTQPAETPQEELLRATTQNE